MPNQITDRQLAVLTAISYGHTNARIAAALHVTVHAVEKHAKLLYRSLGARDRAHAVRLGFELGLLTADTPAPRPRPVTTVTPSEEYL